jgi:uncharacterized protein (TIGR00369 family)
MEILSGSPFSSLVGPIEVTRDPAPVFETVVRDDCSNTMGRVHGGFLAALIDITTGQGVKRILDDGRSLVTATTNTEYLGPARAGDRLRVEVTVEHSASTLVFASCRVSTDDRLVAIASVVFSARPSAAP